MNGNSRRATLLSQTGDNNDSSLVGAPGCKLSGTPDQAAAIQFNEHKVREVEHDFNHDGKEVRRLE
ncbi:MAG TPA: hypothetical protein VHJ59_00290 [Nitrososphaera sp.]|nr:hypothetical protein [Nitrososphaera sp.]